MLKDQLVNYIKSRQLRFFGMTRDDVCLVAYDFARIYNFAMPFNPQKKKAGKDWLEQFLLRHPELSLRQP